MRNSCATLLACAITALVGVSAEAAAQETGALSGVVRNTTGTVIANARIVINAGKRDVTVRSNSTGDYATTLPVGQARVVARMIGYQPFEQTLSITSDSKFDIVLQSTSQQIAAIEVREKWTGIRGIVGDDRTMTPLAGVTVRFAKRNITAVTDSLGRFMIPLPRPERTTLALSAPNYLSRPAVVSFDDANSVETTILLVPGKDPKHLKSSLIDLDRRLGWGEVGMFVADAGALTKYGAQTLQDGLLESGLLTRNGITYAPDRLCIFIDGAPRPDIKPINIPMAGVDFIEVWSANTEDTGTLSARWPGKYCQPQRFGARRSDGPWLSIWTKPKGE